MKRIILIIAIFASTLAFSTSSVDAKVRHHKRHHVATRTVYRSSREHGVNTNANVGVGLGPIHVGVGAGGGVQVHEKALPPDLQN